MSEPIEAIMATTVSVSVAALSVDCADPDPEGNDFDLASWQAGQVPGPGAD